MTRQQMATTHQPYSNLTIHPSLYAALSLSMCLRYDRAILSPPPRLLRHRPVTAQTQRQQQQPHGNQFAFASSLLCDPTTLAYLPRATDKFVTEQGKKLKKMLRAYKCVR